MAITLDTSTLIAASTSDPVTGNHTCDADAKLLVATLVCGVNGRNRASRAAWTATTSTYYTGYEPGFTPSQAIIDAKYATYPFWATQGVAPAHLIVDFGSAISFDHVEIDNTNDNVNRVITSWEIYVSTDCATWGTAIKTGGFTVQGMHSIDLGSVYTKQWIKFRVLAQASDSYVCIHDIFVSDSVAGAPTYNSVPLTQADRTRSASLNPEAFAELWYLTLPDTGSAYAISVPNPLGLSLEVCTSSYIPDADCDLKLDVATGGQNNSSANPSVSTTPITNSAVIVAVVASGHDTWAPSARSGTQLYDTDNGTWGSGHQYYVQDGTPAAKAMSWTQAAEDWGMVVAAFGSYGIGIHVSKSNVYEIVTGSNEALSVAKANVYEVVTGSNTALSVAKANVYEVVTGSNAALSVSKANVYLIIGPLSMFGGFLINPDLTGGFRTLGGGFNK